MILTEKSIDLIEPVIDHSLSVLHERTDAPDIACGLLAALKRLRASLDEIGGYHVVALLDGAIRDRLAIRKSRSGGGDSVMALDRLRSNGLGELVMVATVEACLVYAGQETDLGGMIRITSVLLDRLQQTLGGALDHAALIAFLADDNEGAAADVTYDFEAVPAMVH